MGGREVTVCHLSCESPSSTKILGGVDTPCLRFEITTKDLNLGCLNSESICEYIVLHYVV